MVRFATRASGDASLILRCGRVFVIILDTNVVSELMRSVPSPVVLQSLSSYPANEVCSSTVTLAEILYGIELLPAGKRKNELLAGAERLFGVVLANRILSFDEPAAQQFSHIAADRRRRGKPISELDAQIAAIAHVHGAVLATRNISDFEACGIRVVNPWVD